MALAVAHRAQQSRREIISPQHLGKHRIRLGNRKIGHFCFLLLFPGRHFRIFRKEKIEICKLTFIFAPVFISIAHKIPVCNNFRPTFLSFSLRKIVQFECQTIVESSNFVYFVEKTARILRN